ncbi:hypothetical protein [Flavobacterium litorale]|uniref:SnoaL-like domain-containing protein n=1 Tax=Flavobacterium litorale TaxID=2856519 RepID=A0ABX8V3Y9_9FLAO|nr:hypothetical protein [Flavobacterium litorale]QYJ67520.1 hypothetical protein K1I41_08115 [Flavobacterium litorale]
MKKILLLLIVLLSVPTVKAQSGNGAMDAVILEQANKMGNAFIAGEYDTFGGYAHPTIVTMMGGKEKMVAEIMRSFELIKSKGVAFTAINYGKPTEIIQYEGQLQCTLSQTIKMDTDGGKVDAEAILIAVSMDNGENWYFIDPTGNSIDTMRKIIPTLSRSLKIPEGTPPETISVGTKEN